jgi:hypothetical protein
MLFVWKIGEKRTFELTFIKKTRSISKKDIFWTFSSQPQSMNARNWKQWIFTFLIDIQLLKSNNFKTIITENNNMIFWKFSETFFDENFNIFNKIHKHWIYRILMSISQQIFRQMISNLHRNLFFKFRQASLSTRNDAFGKWLLTECSEA